MASRSLAKVLGRLSLLPNNKGGARLDVGINASSKIAFVKLAAANGTAYYVWTTNDGRVKVSTSEPTANTDGLTVDTSVVDSTTPTVPVGTRIRDNNGNEFIYMQGVTGVDATHNWVSFDENYVTTLLTAGAKGRVAIAMAVIDATTKYGWFQVYGKNTIAGTDAVSDNGVPYIDATAGRIDDAAVTGDVVQGAMIRSADNTNIATVELNYPFVNTKMG